MVKKKKTGGEPSTPQKHNQERDPTSFEVRETEGLLLLTSSESARRWRRFEVEVGCGWDDSECSHAGEEMKQELENEVNHWREKFMVKRV